jgi:NAD(P)H-nitrite reductase large subunit
VKRSTIVNAIKDGAKSLKDIQEKTQACTGNRCKELNPKGRCCVEDVKKILEGFNINDEKSSCCECKGCC